MPLNTFEFVLPFLTVPHVAADALTFGVRVAAFDAITKLEYRVYPYGSTPPAYLSRLYSGDVSDLQEFFTWEGLEEGITYAVDVRATTGSSVEALVQPFTWAPEQNLYPPVSPERLWDFGDYYPQWLAMLAWYYADEPMMSALFRRWGQELQRLDAAMEEITRWAFPSWAYGEGLKRWERAYNIDLPPSATDQQRTTVLLAFTAARLRASALKYLETITALQEGVTPRIEENFAGYGLLVLLAGSEIDQAVMQEVIQRMTPAHLALSFDSANKTFSGRRSRTFYQGLDPHRGHQALEPHPGFDSGRFV